MNVRYTKAARYLMVMFLASAVSAGAARAAEKHVPLSFSGGHEIGEQDFGRPVYLIAAALGVKPEEFRKAFSGVTPARGRRPTRDEERKNKAALMKVLGPLGVTNERLDEVSDYYRFRPQAGELWPTKPASGYAVVDDGKLKKLVITDPGAGYNTPPAVSLPDLPDVRLRATLALGKDLPTNGAVTAVEPVDKPAK